MEFKIGKRPYKSLHVTVLNKHFVWLSKLNRRQDLNMFFRIEVSMKT